MLWLGDDLVTLRLQVRLQARALPGNNLRQIVHTCAKQYNLVPAKGR